ncbi:hypothetical protein F511_30757 [Dorcoceras hygrometricum]|uniref:CCHC-type domain-containing protein n=1 Tax=Dorcoceras hygrometricum TaxID=472368 RepID=A0A2Z7BH77_9LAMI|nr:hypothetical protein F511_30757 [Dorcoceras hygrometricum]
MSTINTSSLSDHLPPALTADYLHSMKTSELKAQQTTCMSGDADSGDNSRILARIAQLLECLVEQSSRRSEPCSGQGSSQDNPQKEFRRKRKHQVSLIKKQKSLDQLPQPSNPNPRMNTKPICPSCRKNHYGQCRVGQDGCYRCGTLAHIAKFCPKLKQPTTGKESVMASDQETLVTIEIPATGMYRVRGRKPREVLVFLKYGEDLDIEFKRISDAGSIGSKS